MAEFNLKINPDDVSLEKHSDRIDQGILAGDTYVENLESIRETLSTSDEGASLGTMVGAQLQMTEAEAHYSVTAGIPKKASAANNAASQDVKKAAG